MAEDPEVSKLTKAQKIAYYEQMMLALSACQITPEDALCLLSKVVATVVVTTWKPPAHRSLTKYFAGMVREDVHDLVGVVTERRAAKAAETTH